MIVNTVLNFVIVVVMDVFRRKWGLSKIMDYLTTNVFA